ncbi:MAG: glycosyltransferase family 4 protein, partial [Bacteroidaceae bacterium]|nr:glycosyltransferase family 4 protein [Bacteroidaceae bacterium]
PDITISTGRREVNFLCDIPDGSVKLCEIHVNRAHYRNFEGKDANPLKNLFARCWMHSLVKTLRRFDRVVCLTETDARSWHELSNVTAIPNPLSSAQDMAATKTGRRVIAVGRYVYEKGFDMLIDAWASVQAKHPNWQLDVFGTGDRTMYQHLVEERGVAASCHLHDADPDIAQRYAESDILAVSSRFEGFGMIIIEAMAEGCVPVSFNCPYGPASIIHDGKDGLLVEDGNVEAMAATLCRVMEREEERAAMSRAAKQTAAQYLIENIAERWIALFDSLCPKR